MPLTFLHLSDLHFRERDLTSQVNPDEDVRNELLRDLTRLADRYQFDAVLVSGDLAFAGKPSEYEAVASFLEEICRRTGVRPDAVWTVPGNHDVDRSKQTRLVARQHDDLRRAAREGQAPLDQALRGYLEEDEIAARLLFAPIEGYNVFADRFGCRSEARFLKWRQDFTLDDGSVLRLHGLNSSLVSGAEDNNNEGKLVLGGLQWRILSEDGVSHVVMCHHPLDWLHEREDIDDLFERRIQLLLCGHKHKQRRRQAGYTVVHAGALHPVRGEQDWDPRYNIIELSLEEQPYERTLRVRVYERQFRDNQFAPVFNTDTEEMHFDFCHRLPVWRPTSAHLRAAREERNAVTLVSDRAPREPQGDASLLTRDLLYRFFRLSLQHRIDIISDMQLVDETDQTRSTQDMLRHALERVKRERRVDELDEAIRAREEQR
jgi:predicted phosphodiesterase